jgi:DNA-binding MarR family transcriptional regulator
VTGVPSSANGSRRQGLSQADFERLLAFRSALRRFLHWSEQQALAVGITPNQHQLLLAVRGHPDPRGPTLGEVADYLAIRHHSAVELTNRAETGGYVTRHGDAHDGRVVRLQLTALGEQRLAHLTQLHLAELAQLAPMLAHLVEPDSALGGGPPPRG